MNCYDCFDGGMCPFVSDYLEDEVLFSNCALIGIDRKNGDSYEDCPMKKGFVLCLKTYGSDKEFNVIPAAHITAVKPEYSDTEMLCVNVYCKMYIYCVQPQHFAEIVRVMAAYHAAHML